MTAENQLKEIAKELGYQETEKDVLFLVKRVVQKTKESLTSKDKVIAKLEAEVDQMRNQFHDLTNEKLAQEQKLLLVQQQLADLKNKEATEIQVQSEPVDNTPTEEEEVPSGQKGN